MGNAKILKTLLLLIFFFTFSFSTYADNEETYVWWDENGQVQYSKTKPDWWKEAVVDPKWVNYETPKQIRERERHSEDVRKRDLFLRAIEEQKEEYEQERIHENQRDFNRRWGKERRIEKIQEAIKDIERERSFRGESYHVPLYTPSTNRYFQKKYHIPGQQLRKR